MSITSVYKPVKTKVCIVRKNTVSNDRRALTEARILASARLEVVVIGLRGKSQPPWEIRDGFVVHPLPPTLGLAGVFRDHLYLPVIQKLPTSGRRSAKFAYKIIAFGLRLVDRWTKGPTIYARLIKAMIHEQAHYYHAHFPAPLIATTFLVAALLRHRFIWDYNDILVLERPRIVADCERNALGKRAFDEAKRRRIDAVILTIPPELKSVLDVGCCDGRITNLLVNLYPRVVGIDISKTALQYVRAETEVGSVESLPLEDKSFDLVLATELLEHLPKHIYRNALGELKRVARRWILIGVPWKEHLALGYAQCARCGTIFHVNHHVRSFNKRKLKTLFEPHFKLIALKTIGGEHRLYMPLLFWVKQRVGHIWARSSSTVCPYCNVALYSGKFSEKNVISNCCEPKNRKIKGQKMPEKRHMVALYERSIAK